MGGGGRVRELKDAESVLNGHGQIVNDTRWGPRSAPEHRAQPTPDVTAKVILQARDHGLINELKSSVSDAVNALKE